jgi:hypothetical protein
MKLHQTFVALALLLEQGHAALNFPDSLLRGKSSQRALQPVGKIDKLRLIDADWDLPFELNNDGVPFDLEEGYTSFDIKYLNTRNWNIEAITSGTVGSMLFNYEGKITIENNPAWAMCAARISLSARDSRMIPTLKSPSLRIRARMLLVSRGQIFLWLSPPVVPSRYINQSCTALMRTRTRECSLCATM